MGEILDRARRAIRNASPAAAIAELDADWQALEQRRQLRAASHVGVRRMHQCGGCSRFLRAVNERCRCGFNNDVRGRRNVGGYA